MLAHDVFVSVFGSVPAGDLDSLTRVVTGAIRSGFAIVLDAPGSKKPVCILNTRERKAADVAAQTAAREKGDERWDKRRHPCGVHHAMTVDSIAGGDSKKVATRVAAILKRVAREHAGIPNIGVEPGLSRVKLTPDSPARPLLVVDVDTAVQDDAYIAAQDAARSQPTSMTVQSPGRVDQDGTWVHKHGGHYWYVLPPGRDLPSVLGPVVDFAGMGTWTHDDGWAAMWSGKQILVPPSVREEGPYRLVGQLNPAPEWLVEMLADAAAERIERLNRQGHERMRRIASDEVSDIDVWSAGITWAELLEPDGWIETGLLDRCSCPTFTAPDGIHGPHADPKSATGHEPGCDVYDTGAGHAPLHIWTDNIPESLAVALAGRPSKTLTKLQYLAARDHGTTESAGLSAAVSGLGLDDPAFGDDDPLSTRRSPRSGPEDRDSGAASERATRRSTRNTGTDSDDSGESDDSLRLVVRSAAEIEMQATDWLWLEPGSGSLADSSEPEHWLPLGGLSLLGGREGVGKSTWAYRIAAQVTRGTLPGACHGTPRGVVIAATEDSWSHTVVPRLAAAGADLGRVFRVDAVNAFGTMAGLVLPRDVEELGRVVAERKVALLLLDPLLGTVATRLDTHKDSDVRQALEPISRLAHDAQLAVIGLIHHNKSGGGDLLTRLMGSRAFSAVARAVLICTREDSSDDSHEPGDDPLAAPSRPADTFVLGQAKSNLGPRVRSSVRYALVAAEVGFDERRGKPITAGAVDVLGRLDEGIDEIVARQESDRAGRSSTTVVGRIGEWLRKELAHGPRESSEIKELAAERGWPESSVKRAVRAIGARSEPVTNSYPRRTRYTVEPTELTELTEPIGPTEPTVEVVTESNTHSRLSRLSRLSRTERGSVGPTVPTVSDVSGSVPNLESYVTSEADPFGWGPS